MKERLNQILVHVKNYEAILKTVIVSLVSGGITALYTAYQTAGAVDLSPAGLKAMEHTFLAGCVVAAIALLAKNPFANKG